MASHRSKFFEPADYALFTTFVLAPTQPSYEEVKESDLKAELKELAEMAEKDIKFLSALKPKTREVFPNPIFTGYSLESKEKLSACIASLASSEAKEIHFVITAHGSPGPEGKFGMGQDDPDQPNYRVTVANLIAMLKESGIEKLKNRHLHFSFRACNSAYVPLDRFNKSAEVIAHAVLEHSLIGAFYHGLTQLGFDNLSVTGFRGYYRPGVKAIQLSDTIGGKKMFELSEGTITIQGNKVILPDINKLLKIQNPKLDAVFQLKRPTKSRGL